QAEPLESARGEHEGIGRAVIARQVLLRKKAQEPHVLRETERRRPDLELATLRAGAADQQEDVRNAAAEQVDRAHEVVEPHPRLQITEREEQRPPGGQPQLATEHHPVPRWWKA